ELTQLGRDLARLPIDPTLGRMLLQSQQEHATKELLIIASGLSIQDPRERPMDQKDAAAAAHKKFNDPTSDFLSLLNIWNAVHDQWESLRTQGQRRKFCRQHFLSYLRMREWQDLHAQLHGALEDLGTLKLNESNAKTEAIHRSILAGLLGHVARREDRNTYKASSNRMVTIFPGSSLYERGEPPKKHFNKPQEKAVAPKPRTNQPQWIVAGEIVETSQLFARTIAGIDPLWILQVAPHCCKLTHTNPHWSASSGRVLVEEIVTLHGLEVQRHKVDYGKINAKDATAVFIRSALVEGDILPPRGRRQADVSSAALDLDRGGTRNKTQQLLSQVIGSVSPSETASTPYPFMAKNQAVRQKIEHWQTRVRGHDLGDIDQALCDFYAKHIADVSSVHDLNRLLRDNPSPGFLCVTEADLIGNRDLQYDAEAFPDAVSLSSQSVSLKYAYAPGEDWDGVTVELPVELARNISPSELAWSVPGLRAGQISELLRSLPKAIRRELMPLPEKVSEIVRDLKPSGRSLEEDLGAFIHQRYGIEVPNPAWPDQAVPAHLQPRVEIVDHSRKTLAAGRDLALVRTQLQSAPAKPAQVSNAWRRA
ncbi:MAG TPA: DUF3418 domain-containing protein, partial [Roseimicrobium sp.]|nr:DUF3418 domain-containing protein [Roseimicrobium sp.]